MGKNNCGGYTAAGAVEFSEMMAKKMGWKNYGDKQYVPHVLQYYAFGRIPAGTGNRAIVQVALTQEGNSGDTYWSWYGFGSRVEWCACFVSWCGEQCGYLESGVIPKFSLCSDGAKWFQSKGKFQDGSYVPAAGDIIFFDWKNDGTIDHVGLWRMWQMAWCIPWKGTARIKWQGAVILWEIVESMDMV